MLFYLICCTRLVAVCLVGLIKAFYTAHRYNTRGSATNFLVSKIKDQQCNTFSIRVLGNGICYQLKSKPAKLILNLKRQFFYTFSIRVLGNGICYQLKSKPAKLILNLKRQSKATNTHHMCNICLLLHIWFALIPGIICDLRIQCSTGYFILPMRTDSRNYLWFKNTMVFLNPLYLCSFQ